jgi:hypothetical protein
MVARWMDLVRWLELSKKMAMYLMILVILLRWYKPSWEDLPRVYLKGI